MSTLTMPWTGIPLARLLAVLVALGAALYLGAALSLAGSPGFPLDDSWIHQTLARSLVREGRLAVNPGEATAASTSPLWTVLLAGGHLLGLAPFWWSHLLGGLLLGWVAALTGTLARRLFPEEGSLAVFAVVLVALEWRLVWAAFSGMETLLFTGLGLALLVQTTRRQRPDWRLGLTGGLTALARPEGSILFGLALATTTLLAAAEKESSHQVGSDRAGGFRAALGGAAVALAVFALVLSPFVAYNVATLGSPLPATFQAKGAFYQQMLTVPFVLSYLTGAGAFFLRGPLLLLAPGALFLLTGLIRGHRPWSHGMVFLLPALWALTLLLLYLIWLPVLYHHGRYLMPALPVALLYGLVGTARLLRRLPYPFLARLLPALVAGLTVGFWINGALEYGWNVRYITDQQVAVARWLQRETPPGTVVATHDIGAIGYFAQRRIVDMAGLITPELTRTPRDRERILATLRTQGVTRAAIIPSWYPWLPQDPRMQEVFRAEAHRTLRLDGDEMRVFVMHE